MSAVRKMAAVSVAVEREWAEDPFGMHGRLADAPTFTLDRQIIAARQSMGEDRWRELNAEWEHGA